MDEDNNMHQMSTKTTSDEQGGSAAGPAAEEAKVTAAGVEKDTAAKDAEEGKAWDTPPLSFPARLMQLLRSGDEPEGIYWLPDGKQFAIHTEKIESVLVNRFQGAKWLSFTRTLNKWGFKKVLGIDLPYKVVAYHSQCFQREKPELVKHMINRSKPGNRKRKAQQWGEEKAQNEGKDIEKILSASQVALDRGTNALERTSRSAGVPTPASPPAAANPPVNSATSGLAAGGTLAQLSALMAASASAPAAASALPQTILQQIQPQTILQQIQDEEQLRLLEQALRVPGSGLSGILGLLQQRQQQPIQANLQAESLLQQRLAGLSSIGHPATSALQRQLQLLHPVQQAALAQSTQLSQLQAMPALNPLARAVLEQQQRQDSRADARNRSDPPDATEESKTKKARSDAE